MTNQKRILRRARAMCRAIRQARESVVAPKRESAYVRLAKIIVNGKK